MSALDLPKVTLFLLSILLPIIFNWVCVCVCVDASTCDYRTVERDKLYSYSLASPARNFAHGVLSEDGFYKVATNDTIIWFQLCDGMIFNHDPPRCVDCLDCGGPSRCGMSCSALVAKNSGGYYVCTTIGRDLSFDINLIDKKTPDMGVNVTMSSNSQEVNCSLSVSVVCDRNGFKELRSFERLGICDYAIVLRHPAGCPKISAVQGGGWGWFSVLLTILLCALVAYLLIGAVYRFFYLGIYGVDAIPNLDFWMSIPHRTKSLFLSMVQRLRGPTYHHRSSYSSVNF